MDGKDLIRTASMPQTMTRAHSVMNRHTAYATSSHPPDLDLGSPFPKALDSVGFICFAIGIPRRLPLPVPGDLTLESIWNGGAPVLPGLFDIVDEPAIGDFYVYPDEKIDGQWRPGHIALVTRVGQGHIHEALHCSSANVARTGDAVGLTAFEHVPPNRNGRIVRIDYDFLKAHLGEGSVSPRLILAVPDAKVPGQFRSFKVRSARIEGDMFVVNPREVGDLLGKPLPSSSREPLRSVLTQLRVRYITDAEPLKDPEDPRAYVFVER